MTALDTLIEAVESGEDWSASRYVDAEIDGYTLAKGAYTRGSLDAALALKDALVPEWDWLGGSLNECMTLYPPDFQERCLNRKRLGTIDVYHEDPARALLLATLKAHREEQR